MKELKKNKRDKALKKLEKLKHKPHVQKIIERAEANGKVVGRPEDSDYEGQPAKRRKRRPRLLKDYEKRSKTDVFSTGRVVSGGGVGTGKRR